MNKVWDIAKEVLALLLCITLVLFVAIAEIIALLVIPSIILYYTHSLFLFVLIVLMEGILYEIAIKDVKQHISNKE